MQALTGKQVSPAAAVDALEQMFTPCSGGGDGKAGGEGARRVTVVLVDEMDLLITKKQQARLPGPACITCVSPSCAMLVVCQMRPLVLCRQCLGLADAVSVLATQLRCFFMYPSVRHSHMHAAASLRTTAGSLSSARCP